MSDAFWAALFGFLAVLVNIWRNEIGVRRATEAAKLGEKAVVQNEEIKKATEQVLDATNGLQAAAISLNRDEAAATALLAERERVATSEKRLEEIRGET